MKRWFAGFCCLLLSTAALGAGPDAVRKQAQASMLVAGSITVASDGSVARYVIDHPEKLPPPVKEMVDASVPHWRFTPLQVAGKPVTAKSDMSIRVVAKPVGDGNYSIGITGATFTPEKNPADKVVMESPTYKHHPPPTYPEGAAEEGATATVYVLAQIDRQGRVKNDLAQQVNLGFVGNDLEMKRWRTVFAASASRAVKRWIFNIPKTGPQVGGLYWYVRIPITYRRFGEPSVAYGGWDVYMPGPMETAPWIKQLQHSPSIGNDKLLSSNIDATPRGGSFLQGGLHMTSKLDGT